MRSLSAEFSDANPHLLASLVEDMPDGGVKVQHPACKVQTLPPGKAGEPEMCLDCGKELLYHPAWEW